MHLSLITIVAYLTAAALSASRILVATRPAWSKMPATVQVVLPMLIPALATLAQELAGVKTGVDLTTVLIGCVLMAVPGLPSNRSAAPLQAGKQAKLTPSAGDVAVASSIAAKTLQSEPPPRMFPTDPPPPSIGGVVALLLAIGFAFHVSGCGIFGSGGSFWPKVENCAPSPAKLVAQVEDVLLAGGDYEAALKQIALQDGAAAVECAVQAAVAELSSKVGASPDAQPAAARGKAFMAKHQVSQ